MMSDWFVPMFALAGVLCILLFSFIPVAIHDANCDFEFCRNCSEQLKDGYPDFCTSCGSPTSFHCQNCGELVYSYRLMSECYHPDYDYCPKCGVFVVK